MAGMLRLLLLLLLLRRLLLLLLHRIRLEAWVRTLLRRVGA